MDPLQTDRVMLTLWANLPTAVILLMLVGHPAATGSCAMNNFVWQFFETAGDATVVLLMMIRSGSTWLGCILLQFLLGRVVVDSISISLLLASSIVMTSQLLLNEATEVGRIAPVIPYLILVWYTFSCILRWHWCSDYPVHLRFGAGGRIQLLILIILIIIVRSACLNKAGAVTCRNQRLSLLCLTGLLLLALTCRFQRSLTTSATAHHFCGSDLCALFISCRSLLLLLLVIIATLYFLLWVWVYCCDMLVWLLGQVLEPQWGRLWRWRIGHAV